MVQDDLEGTSPEYRTFRSQIDAWEAWEVLSDAERCDIILATYPASQWFEEPALPALARLRDDPLR